MAEARLPMISTNPMTTKIFMSAHSSPARGRAWSRIVAIAGMAAVTMLTGALGQWQLRRAAEKTAIQASADEARRAPPLELSAAASLQGLEGRVVRLRGQFVAQATVFVDNRTHQGVAGFHVLTPVRIEGSSVVLMILRGWVPRDLRDRTRLPDVPTPTGPVELGGVLEGRLARSLELREPPVPGAGERLWQNYDPAVFRAWSGLAVADGVLRQDPGDIDDGLVRAWRAAGNDIDKHRAYALQWFVMATAALAVTLYLLLFRPRHVRSDPR
jgi:surfeit locus 1 family protein